MKAPIAPVGLWLLLASAPAVRAQTVVDMDLPTAEKILNNQKLDGAIPFLDELANNYRKFTNVRVRSHKHHESLAVLARALRTDFDGTGKAYIPNLTVWSVMGNTGFANFMVSSQIDRDAVLISTDLDYLKGMVAHELLVGLRLGQLSLDEARRRALALGIEMEVTEAETGERTIAFFGHSEKRAQLVGKLVVIEPPELVWD
jgi:hypothetical protein